MAKQDVPLSLKPYTSPFSSLGREVVNNFYVEVAQSETSKSRYYYVGIPGLKLFKTANNTQFNSSNSCRGLYTTSNGKTYGAFGKYIVEVLSTGAYVMVGELNTQSGIVRWCDNSETVLLVDGSYGYTIETNGNIFNQITEEYFPGVQDSNYGPSHCACIDTYFIVNSRNTTNYFWSAPGYIPYAFDSTKPTVETLWSGLDFGSKIGDADNITGLISCVNLLWVFGQNSIEVHFDSGDSDGQIFQRQQNALINMGTVAPNSITKYGNEVFWLGSDKTGTIGMFRSSTNFTPTRFSTRGVETRIQNYKKIDDCFSYTYSHNGHAFIIYQFPNGVGDDEQTDIGGATWCYDITNDTWTRRTDWDSASGISYMWRGMHTTYNYSKVILGDRFTNALYYLDQNYYKNDLPDGTGYRKIQRIITTPVESLNECNVVYNSVQLKFQQGQGLTVNDETLVGQDPQVSMEFSNDAGNTWSNKRYASIGKRGQYAYRTRWNKCGIGRNRVWKFIITEPVFVAIIGLNIDAEQLGR